MKINNNEYAYQVAAGKVGTAALNLAHELRLLLAAASHFDGSKDEQAQRWFKESAEALGPLLREHPPLRALFGLETSAIPGIAIPDLAIPV